MLPQILRRLLEEPVEITTSAAPVLAPPTDAPPKPAPPPAPIDATPAGLCWHKVHLELDGERVGLTQQRLNPHFAALTRCAHVNEDGH